HSAGAAAAGVAAAGLDGAGGDAADLASGVVARPMEPGESLTVEMSDIGDEDDLADSAVPMPIDDASPQMGALAAMGLHASASVEATPFGRDSSARDFDDSEVSMVSNLHGGQVYPDDMETADFWLSPE